MIGFYKNVNGDCVALTIDYDTCAETDNIGTCTLCLNNTLLSSGQCNSPNVADCLDYNTTGQCEVCREGFELDGANCVVP